MQNSYDAQRPEGDYTQSTAIDLSHTAQGFQAYGASMAGGNSVTETPMFTAPGSASEQTADALSHNSPDLDVGEPSSYTRNPSDG